MGAGDSRQRSDLLAGLPLISKTKRECPVGTPSFVLSGGIAARGKGLPSVSRLRAGRVPPAPAACGPLTLPTLCGGGAAARPACLRQSGKCGGQGRACRRVPVKLAASRSAGHPCPPQGQARKRAHSVRPCPGHSPRSVAALVHPPAPAPLCGADGRARASGLRPPAVRSGLRSRRQPLAAYGGQAGAVGWRVARLRPRWGLA